MKCKLLLLLALVSFNVSAQDWPDSGLWFDPARDGEGLNITVHKGSIVAFVYTYGEYDCNPYEPPVVSPSVKGSDCDNFGQRWFFISGDKMVDGEAQGFLYLTQGVNFPHGIQNPADPFQQIVGEPYAVGIYILRRTKNDGWDMLVLPFGNALDPDDDIFSRVFTFTTQLFPATE